MIDKYKYTNRLTKHQIKLKKNLEISILDLNNQILNDTNYGFNYFIYMLMIHFINNVKHDLETYNDFSHALLLPLSLSFVPIRSKCMYSKILIAITDTLRYRTSCSSSDYG